MSSHRVPVAWTERGYVPPENLPIRDDQDDKGEAAYMRCFHESSKIGRVPNAAYFVNSPTARAYVEKRDKELFPVKEASGNPIPNPDLPSWSSRKEAPTTHPSAGVGNAGHAHSAQYLPPRMDYSSSSPQAHQVSQQAHTPTPPSHGHHHIPWSMEPQTSATGPPTKFR